MDKSEMLRMRLDGSTYASIAGKAGVSRQRIQHILSPPSSVANSIRAQCKGRCSSCTILVGKSGHIHHKKVSGKTEDDYNDISNLTLLCISCHREAHWYSTSSRTFSEVADMEDKQVTFSVILPESLARRLDAYAAEEGRSRASAVRRAIIALLGKAK